MKSFLRDVGRNQVFIRIFNGLAIWLKLIPRGLTHSPDQIWSEVRIRLQPAVQWTAPAAAMAAFTALTIAF